MEAEFRQYAELQQALEYGDMDMGKALAALKNAGALTQDAIDLVDAVKNAELHRKLSKLNLELSGVENELATANREITALVDENASLKKKLTESEKSSAKLSQREGSRFYYKNESSDAVPYCPQCWEGDKKISLINKMGNQFLCSRRCGLIGVLNRGE